MLSAQAADVTGLKSSEQKAKRQRTVSSKLKEYYCEVGSVEDFGEPTMQKLKRQYFDALDHIKSSLNTRFNQKDINIISNIESVLINAINQEDFQLNFQALAHFKYFNLERLKQELAELPSYLKLFNAESDVKIKKVTMVSTLCEMFNTKKSFRVCSPNVHKLIVLYVSIPLSSATAERTFSAMRRVKTWLRSTMSANALTNRMFAVLHKQLIDNVDSRIIAKEFVCDQHERRSRYFGNFD